MQDDNEIIRAIGRLEGKVDSLIVDIRAIEDHEKRIATLEKKQYGILLVGSIIGAVLLTAMRSIIEFFSGS